MGELHLEIIIDRLKRAPQVAYKEALSSRVEHKEVYKEQTGGRGKFADIVFELGPREDEAMGLAFSNEIVGGAIPREFIPSIQKGFELAMANGPLAGYPVEAMAASLKKNQEKGLANIITAESTKQFTPLHDLLAGLDDTIHFRALSIGLHQGFIDHQVGIACYTDHQIFGRYYRYKSPKRYSKTQAR